MKPLSRRSAATKTVQAVRRVLGDVAIEDMPELLLSLYEDLWLERAKNDIYKMDIDDTNDILNWVLNVVMVAVREDHPHYYMVQRIALKLANADATRVGIGALSASPRELLLCIVEEKYPKESARLRRRASSRAKRPESDDGP